jgi:hypothetical protein
MRAPRLAITGAASLLHEIPGRSQLTTERRQVGQTLARDYVSVRLGLQKRVLETG